MYHKTYTGMIKKAIQTRRRRVYLLNAPFSFSKFFFFSSPLTRASGAPIFFFRVLLSLILTLLLANSFSCCVRALGDCPSPLSPSIMPSLLADVPPEVLTSITSFLTDAETISRLCATGNRHLTDRLTNGGVKHIDLAPEEPIGRVFRFVPTLRLVSVSIDDGCLPDELLAKFIRALPSTLLHLEATYNVPDYFWLIDSSEAPTPQKSAPLRLNGLLSHVAPQDKVVWRLKDTFPALQTLNLLNESREWELDVLSTVTLLCGLPDTLTDLTLCFLATYGIDFYPMLPPNLERLAFGPMSSTTVLPTSKHAHYLRHLTSICVSITKEWEAPVPEEMLGSWEPANIDETTFWLPPTLTDLSLGYASEHLHLLVKLPLRLTKLALQLEYSDLDEESLFQALSFVPTSVTDLTLMSYTIKDQEDDVSGARGDILDRMAVHLLALKRFVITGDLPPSTQRKLLKLMPKGMESFEYHPGSFLSSPLSLETVALLDGSRLHTLSAPWTSECFPDGVDTSPLASLFPQLRTLSLASGAHSQYFDLNFASIPPTVTVLKSNITFNSTYLHLLPPSVTKLNLFRLRVSTEGEYYHLISTGFSSSSDVLHLEFPSKRDIYDPRKQFATPLVNAHIEWPDKLLPMPRTLTSLSIPSHCLDDSFNSDNLPCLKKLSYNGFGHRRSSNIPTGSFTTLEDLDVPVLDDFDACPPNLTRLVVAFQTSVPTDWIHNLPTSLTHLECKVPLENVSHLHSLKVFINQDAAGTLEDFLKLSDSMASMAVQSCMDDWTQEDLESFFRHFSSLDRLELSGNTLMSTLERIRRVMPSRVFLKVSFVQIDLREVDVLTALVGIGRGQLPCYPGESSTKHFDRLLSAALAPISIRCTVPALHDDELELLVLPYLSPSPKEVKVCNATDFERQEVPWSSITSVDWIYFDPALFSPNTDFHFPTTLTKLKMGQKMLCPQRLLELLPTGLRCLEIPNGEIDFVFASWPPQLTQLTVNFTAKHIKDNLLALPSSLTCLDLGDSTLDEELYPDIPKQVTRLTVSNSNDNLLKKLEFAKERGNLVWSSCGLNFLHDSEELLSRLDFASHLEQMVRILRNGASTVLMDVDKDEGEDHVPQDDAQFEDTTLENDTAEADHDGDEYDLPAPTRRNKRLRSTEAQ